MYNHTTIMQLDICKVKVEHNMICKICNFFVVPGNRQALLGPADIELLNILTISCNTIGTQRKDKDVNCSTNRHSIHGAESGQCCANTVPERSCMRKNSNMHCYTNTGNDLNLNNNNNALTPTVKNNNIKYFLPSPSKESDRKASAEITELQRDFEDVLVV